jgi:hypothetical protein
MHNGTREVVKHYLGYRYYLLFGIGGVMYESLIL